LLERVYQGFEPAWFSARVIIEKSYVWSGGCVYTRVSRA
jgi:hypothetical protein